MDTLHHNLRPTMYDVRLMARDPHQPSRERPWLGHALLAGVLVLFAVHSLSYHRMMVDDAFISYRYADNLARGHGLVFNPGERVEGYSNFTLILLLAPFARMGADLLIVSKAIGFLAGLAAILYTVRLSSHLTGIVEGGCGTSRGLFRFLPAFFLASSASFALWTMGGIETSLFAALLLAGLHHYMRWQEPGRARPARDTGEAPATERAEAARGAGRATGQAAASGLLLAAAGMSRPEGILFAAALALDAMMRSAERRRLTTSDALWAACVGFPYAAYLGWKLSYYGTIVPNTYYAKVWGGWALRVKALNYGYEFVMVNGGALLIVLVGVALLSCGLARTRPLWLFIGANVVFVFTAGTDWMPLHRFLVPSLAPVFLLASEGVRTVNDRLKPAGAPSALLPRRAVVTLLVIAFAGFAYAEERYSSGNTRGAYRYTGEFAIADWLRANARQDQRLAIDSAGIPPYFTRMPTLDILGICDPHIARRPGYLHDKSDPDYVLAWDPDFIVLCGSGESPSEGELLSFEARGYRKPEEDVQRHSAFRAGYEPAALFRLGMGYGVIYRKKALEAGGR